MNINSATADTAPAPISAPAHIAIRLQALPPCASAKYAKLRSTAQRARATLDGLQLQIDATRETRAAAQRDLGIYDRHHPGEQFAYEVTNDGTRKRVPAPDPHRAELAAAVDSATAELARLQEEARSVVIPNIGTVDDWLARQDPGAKFVPAIFPAPKVGKNEPTSLALARIIEDQRRLADELATVQNAPRTTAEVKAAMRAEIDALAARGRPDVAGLFTGDAISWPKLQVVGSGFGAHQYSTVSEVADTVGLFAWLHRDALIAALNKEVEAQGSDEGALSAEDQAGRIAELETNLLHLHRRGEALIERLEGDGIPVHRTCLIPEVLLGIERVH